MENEFLSKEELEHFILIVAAFIITYVIINQTSINCTVSVFVVSCWFLLFFRELRKIPLWMITGLLSVGMLSLGFFW